MSTPQRLREHCRRGKPIRLENLLNEKFQRLANITGENLVFREQELGPALKRRAIAVVYNADIIQKKFKN